jgi:hypothetical protein
MACGRPSVSTSIRDVVEPYGHVVRIADTPEGFIADCEMIMARTPAEQEAHARELAEIVSRTSWDNTANAMAQLIAQADELADSEDFVKSQPMIDEEEGAPLNLADAGNAVAVVGPRGDQEGERAAAAG